ncbi:MAG: hypothetical protein P4L16_00720 [Chlamydiales bacterium]|nr:hypothetical protein [Chlamydiales bacterium]
MFTAIRNALFGNPEQQTLEVRYGSPKRVVNGREKSVEEYDAERAVYAEYLQKITSVANRLPNFAIEKEGLHGNLRYVCGWSKKDLVKQHIKFPREGVPLSLSDGQRESAVEKFPTFKAAMEKTQRAAECLKQKKTLHRDLSAREAVEQIQRDSDGIPITHEQVCEWDIENAEKAYVKAAQQQIDLEDKLVIQTLRNGGQLPTTFK